MAKTNILLTTFPGLSLPPTISFALRDEATTDHLLSYISSLLPAGIAQSHLILTTTSNKCLNNLPTTPLSDLTRSRYYVQNEPHILPLRLSALLPGGKGGFGSQLRAAGGRMSSRKKRNSEQQNGSNRNLDGRRLRTITEAKNLAAYLATKPDMDRREKEERRKRWEMVVEAAERREEEVRSGKKGKGLSEEWIAEKEEVGESVKDAVRKAMMAGAGLKDDTERKTAATRKAEVEEGSGSASGSGGSDEASDEDSDQDMMELDEDDMQRLKDEAATGDVDAIWVLKHQVVPARTEAKKPQERRFAGFDEDDEFLSSEEEVEKDEVDDPPGKGKGPA